jgi:hypothetical protein
MDGAMSELPTVAETRLASCETIVNTPQVPSPWWQGKIRKETESRGLLYLVLLIQTGLSLRLSNTAFNDEATYIMVGHAEIAHMLHATVIPNYDKVISGAPFIYPPLAAAISFVGGLQLVRILSLCFMLLSTSLVFGLTRRLFGWGAGVLGAATFAIAAPTLFMGNLATYDAMTVFLLALASWLGVVGTEKYGVRIWAYEAAAGLVAGLAAATKYSGLLFLPSICAAIFLADLGHRYSWRSLVRTTLPFNLGAAAILVSFWIYAHGLVAGFRTTTISPTHVRSDLGTITSDTALYVGAMLILGVIGVLVIGFRRERLSKLLLGVVLASTGFLAPLWQLHVHTYISLEKHVGYGLLFVAPMVGVALSGGIVPWRRRAIVPVIAILIVLVSMGSNTSQSLYSAWPNTTNLLHLLQTKIRQGDSRYLVEEGVVPEYYFASVTHHDQWVSTYGYSFREEGGATLTGAAAFKAAITHSSFELVALSNGPTKSLDMQLERTLKQSHAYRLIATLHYDTSFGPGVWRVWQRS